jgi:hypothetical protein
MVILPGRRAVSGGRGGHMGEDLVRSRRPPVSEHRAPKNQLAALEDRLKPGDPRRAVALQGDKYPMLVSVEQRDRSW